MSTDLSRFSGGPTPGKPRKKKRLPKIISEAEAARLLDACSDGTDVGIRNRAILEVMYRAGLRVGEVVTLKPRDYEQGGVIRIYDGKGGDGTCYFDPARLNPVIQRWLDVRGNYAERHSPLFCHPDGTKISTRYVQRLVERLKHELGIQGIVTPHVFRHTYATELLAEGFTITDVQRALRHAHLATTAVYLHVRDDALRAKMAQRSTKGDE
jgi:site-specific recombinase XerD